MEDPAMTYRRDPGRPRNPLADDLLNENQARRDDELALRNAEATNTYGIVPIVLSLLILIGVGYFAYTFFASYSPWEARTTEYAVPRTVTRPPPPATPAPAQTK
jgi:hypothetical protein